MVAMAALFGLLGAPVLVLGYAQHLTAASVGLGSALLSAGTFVASMRGRDPRAHLHECGRAALAIAGMPLDAVREAARARSVVLLGLLWSGGVLALAFLLTLLIPYASWDGFTYHEPIVGYAIQNHGFAVVELPPNQPVQSTNGYPKLCEAVSLWFVVFTDKTLVELPNDLAAVGLMWSVYALGCRYTDRVTALGGAVVLFLVPATWTQICSTMIDVQVGFFLVVAMYYATRPRYRVRDALVATFALALVVESKSSAPAWVPPIALIAYGRLLIHHVRARRLATIATVVGGGAFVAGLEAHLLLRNWVAFHNPLWPIAYTNPKLGIAWSGLTRLQDMAIEPPLPDILHKWYHPPIEGLDDVILRGYGYAVPWVVVPVAMTAVVFVVVAAALELIRLKERGVATNLFWVLIPALIGLRVTPSVDISRYNLHIVAALIVAAAWLVSRRRWVRAKEGLVAAAIVLSIMPAFWLKGWGWFWGAQEDMAPRLLHPFSSPHAYVDKPFFDLLCKERYEEIGPGDRAAYDQEIHFAGALWNFDFSNRVEYIPYFDRSTYLSRVQSYAPKWIAVGNGDAQRALESTGQWQVIGRLTGAEGAVVLRRKR
jgi:hypothetical protein